MSFEGFPAADPLILSGDAWPRGHGQAADRLADREQVRQATIGRIRTARSEGLIDASAEDYLREQALFHAANDPFGMAELQGIADGFVLPIDDLFAHLHLGTLRDLKLGAKLDGDGAIWLMGRVDDVMNVSGHRISTTEVESALVSHESVAEAAVVGAQDAITGQGIVAFVILRGGIDHANGEVLVKQLRDHVAKEIGAIAKPRQIMVVNELPKTRSGKIMRRLLKDVAENRAVGDATTLADPNVMKLIAEGLQSATSED